MNKILKHYHSYLEMIHDFGTLSSKIDVEKSLRAPLFSFFTTDGIVHLGGSFQIFMVKIKEETGINLLPASCLEMPGFYVVSFEDYAEVEYAEEVKTIEIQPVDTPARKRSQRRVTTS